MHQSGFSATDKHFLQSIYDAALKPTLPRNALQGFVAPEVAGKTYLFAAGKAATQMAAAVLPKLTGDVSGLVVTRKGYAESGFNPEELEIIEASHPVPDKLGLLAAKQAVAEISQLKESDLLLALISGGASALLPLPTDGVTLEEKQAVTKQLLRCGAPISEMNIVRKHLSAIKGGRLAAAAYPAQTQMIGISDVPGDDLETIGSGPTIGDPSTLADARAIIARYALNVAPSIGQALTDNSNETPKPDDPRLSRNTASLCARPADLVAAAARAVEYHGYEAVILGDDLEGDAVVLGRDHAERAIALKSKNQKIALISGGEATVKVTNAQGRGGRNTTFLLACAIALDGEPGITGFAADTDGIDGSEDHAGAFLWPGILSAMGGVPKAEELLANNNSYDAFSLANALMITGPSGTNVNDLRLLLVDP